MAAPNAVSCDTKPDGPPIFGVATATLAAATELWRCLVLVSAILAKLAFKPPKGSELLWPVSLSHTQTTTRARKRELKE